MKQLFLFGISLFILFSTGCKKAGNDQQVSIINGSVLRVDKNNQIVHDASGINVSFENSGYPKPLTVNSNGKFKLPELTGSETITLEFSYPGYGTVKQHYRSSDLAGTTSLERIFYFLKVP
jgi:hypothetical protein